MVIRFLKKILSPFRRHPRTVSLVLVLCSSLAFGVARVMLAASDRFDTLVDKQPRTRQVGDYLQQLADRFGALALFAEVVYRRDLPEAIRDGNGCRYLSGSDSTELVFGMPDGPAGGKWRRWTADSPAARSVACADTSGLYYEIFVHVNPDGVLSEAVVAIRGTENRAGQYLLDWGTNVAAALGYEPKQYKISRQAFKQLIPALRAEFARENAPLKISVVGHSLGGGLAQQAGYLFTEVREVVAFNSSPVTNWASLRFDGEIRNPDPTIYRLYHGGEILEKIRFVSTSLTATRYNRFDISVQFGKRGSFSGHGMQVIACGFADILKAAKPATIFMHNYSQDFVSRCVIGDELSVQPDAGATVCKLP
jgi:hypothetical protein